MTIIKIMTKIVPVTTERENEHEPTSMRPRTSKAEVFARGNPLCGTLYLRLVTSRQLLEK